MPLLDPVPLPRRSPAIRAAWVAFLLAAVGLAPAVGAQTAPAQAAPAAPVTRITIKDFGFSPGSLAVAPGTVITVINKDDAPHTLTGTGRAGFNTGTIKAGRSATFTAPRTRGTYSYICDIHQFMSGTLTVR